MKLILNSLADGTSSAWVSHPEDGEYRLFLWDTDYRVVWPHIWDMQPDGDAWLKNPKAQFIANFRNWEAT